MKLTELTSKIVSYELGELEVNEVIDMFSELVKSGMVMRLQGCYWRTAVHLMEAGYLDWDGEVLNYLEQ